MEPIPAEYHPNNWNQLDRETFIKYKQGSRKRMWVDTSKIIGTIANARKWFPERFFHIVDLLQSNQYDYDHARPPVLFKLGQKYYVATDGNHRVLAFKYLKLKRIFAAVVELTK